MLEITSFAVIVQAAVLVGFLGIMLVLEHLRAQGVKREQMAEQVEFDKFCARLIEESKERSRADWQYQKWINDCKKLDDALRGGDEKSA